MEAAMRELPVFEAPVEEKKKGKGSNALLWIIVIFLVVCVAPAVGCGAFGFTVAMAGSQPMDTGVGPAVGVIRVDGAIMSGPSTSSLSGSVVGSDTIVDLIKQAGA